MVVLGVPKAALVREATFGTRADILKLAESSFRALSRRYHPDIPSGDADLYTVFGNAIEELRDPDALDYYIDELLDTADVQALYQRRQAQAEGRRDARVVSNLVRSLDFVDQFLLLGIDRPTSYFVSLEAQRVVLDVSSPHQAMARVTRSDERSISPLQNFRYANGVWSEQFIFTDGGEEGEAVYDPYEGKPFDIPYRTFLTRDAVTFVGFAPQLAAPQGAGDSVLQVLESTSGETRLAWQEPQFCWFLPYLRYTPDSEIEDTLSPVLYKSGRFAILGSILSTAPME